MKIDKFDIKGLHGRFNFKAKLDRNVNILVGNNGSYKSSLLNILSILLQSVSLQEKYAVDEAVVTLAGPQGLIGYRTHRQRLLLPPWRPWPKRPPVDG